MTLFSDTIKSCSHEGCLNTAKKAGISKLGFVRYRKYCNKHNKQYYEKNYRLHKKDQCEKCGFIAEHECQLDVDHIDGNRNNNHPLNLQTLCANCHRFKTHLNKEYKKAPEGALELTLEGKQ
jgi:hypothetical protein